VLLRESMIVKDDYCFVSIPKSGSTSFMIAADPESVHQAVDVYHATADEVATNIGHASSLTKILYSVVRDPWSRVLSYYKDLISIGDHKNIDPAIWKSGFICYLEYILNTPFDSLPRHVWPSCSFLPIDSTWKEVVLIPYVYYSDLFEIMAIPEPRVKYRDTMNVDLNFKGVSLDHVVSFSSKYSADYILYSDSLRMYLQSNRLK
jgi:Sulfotransferase family